MTERKAGHYGRPAQQTSARSAPWGTVHHGPRLTVTKTELAEMVGDSVALATVDALKKQLRKQRARQAKSAPAKLQKSSSADLARHMAAQAQATRQRQVIAEVARRFERETDPAEKSQLSQRLTYERLRLAHAQGRI
jgi:hypothetical protein